jgi:hypothetical protein
VKHKNTMFLVALSVVVLSIAILLPITQAAPGGASITPLLNETAPVDSAGEHSSIAGNVTELTITGFSTTQSWQGYFGNVTGVIQLADSSDAVLYNWSLATPEGEVYASRNSSITWTNIQCFNFTAKGNYTAEPGGGGTTSLYGTNTTGLENEFNIASDDVDGVNETFTLSGGGTHDAFFTASQSFSEGECQSTRVFGDTGAGVNDEFEEVLLYEPTSRSVVFASILDDNLGGFDNNLYDFEMLVLEDGHGTDTAVTTAYFFVELE